MNEKDVKLRDMKNKEPKVGDDVMIEQCWESEDGMHHDEVATIKMIKSDGTLVFIIGHWKKRTQKDQALQAWLNKQEIYLKDVYKI